MSDFIQEIERTLDRRTEVGLEIRCMGTFEGYIAGDKIASKSWSRDKTLQLFQFFITARHRRALHKEQIISRLWEDADEAGGARDFKVALHGISKAIEPERKSRTQSKYIIRQGLSYQLNMDAIWIDADVIDRFITIGNATLNSDPVTAARAFREAINLHHGVYLPNRLYEDWSSEERERLNVSILGAYISLAQLVLDDNPAESIQLCQEALILDKAWEDAYRIQMLAYMIKGNRPQAIKTFNKCREVLLEEYDIEPLPQTKQVMDGLLKIGRSE